MSEAELEAERIALHAEQRALEHAHEWLRQTPDDHAARWRALRPSRSGSFGKLEVLGAADVAKVMTVFLQSLQPGPQRTGQ